MTQSSTLSPQPPNTETQPSVLNPQSSNNETQSSVLSPQSSKPETQSSVLSPQSSKPETQSSVLSPQSSKPARWLITGGCGFIGTALIKHLIQNNLATHIRVLDNLTVGTREDLANACDFTEVPYSSLSPQSSVLNPDPSPQSSALSPENNHAPRVELLVGDIRDPETCEKCCQNIDVIIHLAANTGVPQSVENPRLDMESNVIGTFNMLEGTRRNGVKRFVFASSGAPAGEVVPPIHEELPPHPVSPYGASKLAGEGYCSAYYKTFGIETVALRFSNVYGPGSSHKSSVVAKFIKQSLNGETLVIYGDGTQTRDFIYIDDLINAIQKSATLYWPNSSVLSPQSSKLKSQSSALSPQSLKIGGETFQIATNRETTLDEMTELLLKVLAEKKIVKPRVKKTKPRLGDVKRNFSDTSKALKHLNWQCEWDLPRGMRETVAWFLDRQNC